MDIAGVARSSKATFDRIKIWLARGNLLRGACVFVMQLAGRLTKEPIAPFGECGGCMPYVSRAGTSDTVGSE